MDNKGDTRGRVPAISQDPQRVRMDQVSRQRVELPLEAITWAREVRGLTLRLLRRLVHLRSTRTARLDSALPGATGLGLGLGLACRLGWGVPVACLAGLRGQQGQQGQQAGIRDLQGVKRVQTADQQRIRIRETTPKTRV